MLPRRLSALVLSLSLLGTAACGASAVRSSGDAGPGKVAVPIKPIKPAQPALDRAQVKAALMERRQLVFERFLAYREGRVYPVNTYGDGFEHVWLDSFGNLCAAATLISGDWGRDVTANVSREDNFIALASVHDGPLADWILTSGLTHHEIVAIQVPGWNGGIDEPGIVQPVPEPDPRAQEISRLYETYVDVERQLVSMWDESLEDAVDDLMKRPDLARELIDGRVAGPGRFGRFSDEPVAAQPSRGFAQPPPA